MPSRKRSLPGILRDIERPKRKPRRKPEVHERIHRTARRAEPKLARGFRKAIEQGKADLSQRQLVAAIKAGRIDAAVDLVPVDTMVRQMRAEMGDAFVETFQAAGRVAGSAVGLQFSVVQPQGLHFIEAHGAEFIREFGRVTRAHLRDQLADMAYRGLSAAEAARGFSERLGLTSRLGLAVENFRAKLIAREVPDARIARLVAAKEKALLRYRAESVARTEAQNAATGGQLEAWRQAIDEGLIDPAEREVEWLTTSAPCEICDPMNGQRRAFGELFNTGDGRQVRGPGGETHVNCLCSLLTVPKKARVAA